jgi:RNA-directed DNA polymerase
MRRVRQRVRELTPKSRCHADIRKVIGDVNPVLRGWSNDFRTGNAARQFGALDDFVLRRLRALRCKRKGRSLRSRDSERWRREYFEHLGLHRLRGTVSYPGQPLWKGSA